MPGIESLIGRWRIDSEGVDGAEDYIHVDHKGRWVHFLYVDGSSSKPTPMPLWFTHTGGDNYDVRHRVDGTPWQVSCVRTDEGIDIVRPGKVFSMARVDESDLPEWFEERLSLVLKVMDQRAEECCSGPKK